MLVRVELMTLTALPSVSHLALAIITIADMLKSDQLCAQCGAGMVQGHDAGHESAAGGSEDSPAAT